MPLLKVKDHSTLKRDSVTGAIVAVDNAEWYKAKSRLVGEQILKDRNESIRELQDQVSNLQEKLDKIVERLDAPKPTLFERVFGKRDTSKGKAKKRDGDLQESK